MSSPDTLPEGLNPTEATHSKEVADLLLEIGIERDLLIESYIFQNIKIPTSKDQFVEGLNTLEDIRLLKAPIPGSDQEYTLDLGWSGEWIANPPLADPTNTEEVLRLLIILFDLQARKLFAKSEQTRSDVSALDVQNPEHFDRVEGHHQMVEQNFQELLKLLDQAVATHRMDLLKKLLTLVRSARTRVARNLPNEYTEIG